MIYDSCFHDWNFYIKPQGSILTTLTQVYLLLITESYTCEVYSVTSYSIAIYKAILKSLNWQLLSILAIVTSIPSDLNLVPFIYFLVTLIVSSGSYKHLSKQIEVIFHEYIPYPPSIILSSKIKQLNDHWIISEACTSKRPLEVTSSLLNGMGG